MLAPIFFAHAESERRRAAAGEYTHRAVRRLEAMLRVERRPRAALFIFRKGDGAVGVAVAL